MTDERYEIMFKDLDCCQNCIHFSLGIHFDGCGDGWCHCGEWTIHPRADVCDKYKRRIEPSEKTFRCSCCNCTWTAESNGYTMIRTPMKPNAYSWCPNCGNQTWEQED